MDMRKIRFPGFLFLLFVPSLIARAGGPQPAFRFIENKNQWQQGIDFAARVPGGNLFIQPGLWKFSFLDEQAIQAWHEHGKKKFRETNSPGGSEECLDGEAIALTFVGANPDARAYPFGMNSTTFNYFIGNDPGKWGSNARAFEGIVYRSLYQGVDLKIYSDGNNIKYDFILAPGADPMSIVEEYQGAELTLSHGSVGVPGSIVSLRAQQPVATKIGLN